MTQFVLVATHQPDMCPTANSKIRKLFIDGVDVQKFAKKAGVKFLAGPLTTTGHKMISIIEADNVESVRNFVMESGTIQWNSVEITHALPMDKTVNEIRNLDPIW
jgi:uncharacterized protein with GYD domain